MNHIRPFLFLLLLPLLQYCQPGNSQNLDEKNPGPANRKQFSNYWHQGKAEITSYTLEQARYGQVHSGESVLIFVTEDFSKSKQVKLDNPGKNPSDAINVLKLNLTKKFTTGIYPYSIMLSVFSAVQQDKYPLPLKATASAQEWCGHTYSQLNLNGNKYHFTLHSYFESEGEQNREVPAAIPEDELWTRIRINPASLPLGQITLIPSLLTQRLRHTTLQNQVATATLQAIPAVSLPQWLPQSSGLIQYQVQYPAEERTLSIYFTEAFPHQISGWEETYPDGFGANARLLTTRAVKKKTMLTDYWTKNKQEHTILRDSLALPDPY